MGLFDKKVCDICGKEIKLLGNRKLDDGNCCKDCASKLSPFFTDRKRTTVADIKRQLEYRAKNETELASLAPTKTLGNGMKVHVDTFKKKFIVTASSDWKKNNPDIISLDAVKAVKVEVTEDADEELKEDESGNEVSYDPPRYTYSYKFWVTISVNSEWFDEIDFEVSEPGNRPTSPDSDEYKECAKTCHAIRCALMPAKYTEANMVPFDTEECTYVASEDSTETESSDDTWTCPGCGKTASGNFCVSCGTQKPADDSWYCPNCGNKVTGNFCTKCGTKKPETETAWYCPNCGNKVEEGAFCSKCGTKKPE